MSLFGPPVYTVSYFADEAARERFERTVERFVDDYDGGMARAAEVGKTNRWVKFVSLGFADTDTTICMFGTGITHEVTEQRRDNRGRFRCNCFKWLDDEDARDAHHDLAGWPRDPRKKRIDPDFDFIVQNRFGGPLYEENHD